MNSSTSLTTKWKNIFVSILWGIGYTIAGFFVGTLSLVILPYPIYVMTGICDDWGNCEGGLEVILIFSVIGGLLVSVISGIIGIRRTYKRLSVKS